MNFISKLFIFSEFFSPISKGVSFVSIVIYRFFKILFSSSKRLSKIELTYQRTFRFENSYLIINYRFKNALWYSFSSYKTSTKDGNIVFNISRLHSTSIKFIVYGFFQRKTYIINFKPENRLISNSFQTTIKTNKVSNYSKSINLVDKSNLKFSNKIETYNLDISLKSPKVSLKKHTTGIKHTNFIKSEFI
jgi:hypothetical protein